MSSKTTIRLVLAISLDGRIAFSNGGKSDLGGKGDRESLEDALAWCDATLMGSNTLKAHKNTCLIHNKKLIEKRLIQNRSPQPLSVIVSEKQSFPNSLEFFSQPIQRAILGASIKEENKSDKYFEYHFRMKPTWSETIKDLNKNGYINIVILGGSKLIQSLVEEDQIDELQLTFTPRILGGQYTWIPAQMNNIPIQLTEAKAWRIENIEKLLGNEVMIKYSRNRF